MVWEVAGVNPNLVAHEKLRVGAVGVGVAFLSSKKSALAPYRTAGRRAWSWEG